MSLRARRAGAGAVTGSSALCDESILVLAAARNVALSGKLPTSNDQEVELQERWIDKHYSKCHFEISSGSKEERGRVKNALQHFADEDVLTLHERFDNALKIMSEDPCRIDTDRQEAAAKSTERWRQVQGAAMGGGGENKALSPRQLQTEAKKLHRRIAFVLCAAGACESFQAPQMGPWLGGPVEARDEPTMDDMLQSWAQAETGKCLGEIKGVFEQLADNASQNFTRSPVTLDLGVMVTSSAVGRIWLANTRESASTVKALTRGESGDPDEDATEVAESNLQELDAGLPEAEINANEEDLALSEEGEGEGEDGRASSEQLPSQEEEVDRISLAERVHQKSFVQRP